MFGEELATQIALVESPQMVSIVKLHILKKGEYTLWSMWMEQYLTNTDYSLWQYLPEDCSSNITKTQRERKASKNILLFAYSECVSSEFPWNKGLPMSCGLRIKKGLDKAYDRFQKLISLLEDSCAVKEFEVISYGYNSQGKAFSSSFTLDDSVYRLTTNKTSASVSQVEASTSQTSNTSVEMPIVESVRPSGVIIKDWVSDDEDIY
ncbi:hypothetical protein Tco_1066331 [Tanacetum coccineum]|uniref:Uncharacterized protein n=1 Tax=Tanacetum coccineum TaxID=301880 RepID=A0ABQ5HAY6_9ASTR